MLALGLAWGWGFPVGITEPGFLCACVSSCVGMPPRQMNSYCSHFIAVCLFLLLWDGDVPWDEKALILVLPGLYAFLCMVFPFVIRSSISLLPSPHSGQGREWELQWVALAMPHASGCLFSSMARLAPKKENKPKHVSGFELQIWVFKMHEMRNFRCLLQHQSTCAGHEWCFLFMLRLLNKKLKQESRQLWMGKMGSGWRRGRVWCVFIITDFGCGKGKLKRCLEPGIQNSFPIYIVMCEVPVFYLPVNIDSYCYIKVILTFSMERFSFWFLAISWPTFPNHRTCHAGVIQPSLRCECLLTETCCVQRSCTGNGSACGKWRMSGEGSLTLLLWNLKVLVDGKQWLQSCLGEELPLVTDTAMGLLSLLCYWRQWTSQDPWR